MKSNKRSIALGGRRTSLSVEDGFWNALRDIAAERHETLSQLISSIDAERQSANRSSAIRLFVLGFYQRRVSLAYCEAALNCANGFTIGLSFGEVLTTPINSAQRDRSGAE
jgi:predicted DNA-binding ribbon-helix-helix protein